MQVFPVENFPFRFIGAFRHQHANEVFFRGCASENLVPPVPGTKQVPGQFRKDPRPLHGGEGGTTSYEQTSIARFRAAWRAIVVLNSSARSLDRRSSEQCKGMAGFRFIDLFAGIGGLRLPFDRLGGTCVFSSEIDKFARQTYEANFGEQPSGDITVIDEKDIPKHDLLVGGFPCQPFSIAGVSKYNSLGWDHGFKHDTKGTLFFDIVRILKHHMPKAFLLENVRNLKSHDKGRTYRVILETLEELGYTVSAKVINAKLVVPQHRERIFIVGILGEEPFVFPEIEDRSLVLGDILLADADIDAKYTISDHLWNYLQEYKKKHQAKGNGFGFGMVTPEMTTRTLSARYYKDGSEILLNQGISKNPRRLTPRECARLMGFPDTFQIPVSDTQAYKQFGNAVVSRLVDEFAGEIVRHAGFM
jgi:DNA (cytosine-5)-methyltransferase 1